jgi:hypothetical protein
MALPKGQAFALVQGGRLWKLRLPLPDASKDPHMPEDLTEVSAAMQRAYRTSHDWYLDREGEALLMRGGSATKSSASAAEASVTQSEGTF